MFILESENLSLSRQGHQILKNINLKIKRGSIHCLLGPNGAGKSSLAYVLVGLSDYKPDEGKIYFDSEEITNWTIWQRARFGLTLAWQEPVRFEGLTIRDYIKIGAKGTKEEEVDEILEAVLLNSDDYKNRAVDKTLSGGERKRIELASVISMRPKLAILDEPDSGIDMIAFDNIIQLIECLKDRGITVLLITHREELARISDKTSLICGGSIIKEGEPLEVSKFYKSRCRPCSRYTIRTKEGKNGRL